MKNLSEKIRQELPKLEQDLLVELFTIDCSAFGGEVYNLCNLVNEKNEPITFGGIKYQPYPLEATGFAINSKGASNRPTLTLSNMFGLVTALEAENKILGAVVWRKQVYAKYLDPINFIDGNPYADSQAVAVAEYRIEAVKSLNKNIATLELAVPAESDGLKIPRRVIISNTSPSAFKKSTGVLAYRD